MPDGQVEFERLSSFSLPVLFPVSYRIVYCVFHTSQQALHRASGSFFPFASEGHRGQVLQCNSPPAGVCRWHDLCALNSPGACFLSPRAEIAGSPVTWKMLIACRLQGLVLPFAFFPTDAGKRQDPKRALNSTVRGSSGAQAPRCGACAVC
jgi:hypothetical protein